MGALLPARARLRRVRGVRGLVGSRPRRDRRRRASEGRAVARADDARWCLDLVDRLQAFVIEHGRFDPARRVQQLGDLVAVLDRARIVYREVVDRSRR